MPFLLAAFKIFYLYHCLFFNIWLWCTLVSFLCVILLVVCWASRKLGFILLIRCGHILAIISSNIFLPPIPPFPSELHYMYIRLLDIGSRSFHGGFVHCFPVISFYVFIWIVSSALTSSSLNFSSAVSGLLLSPHSKIFILYVFQFYDFHLFLFL